MHRVENSPQRTRRVALPYTFNWRRLSVVGLVLACAVADCGAAHGEDRYELRGAVSPHATAARLLGRAAAAEQLTMTVTLPLQHRDELAALIAAQQDPNAPEYHRWLSPQEFTARFAPSQETYAALQHWVQREGFAARAWPNRLRIDFSGSVERVEACFAVRMNQYQFRGAPRLANENPPLIPSQFAASVELMRLNDLPLAMPMVRVAGPGGVETTMAPGDMYLAYDVAPLLGRGIDGSGQTIAVVARSDFNLSDVAQFQQQFGVPVHDPLKVFPTVSPGVGAANGICKRIRNPRQFANCVQGEEGEVILDTEWAGAMAPGATVLVDIAGVDIDASLADIVNNHPEAKQVTMSFGSCERLDASDRTLFGPMYAQAAAQGQTIVVVTGDSGADDCQDGRGASVNVLADDPNVTAVGGTALDPGFDAAGNATRYVSESVWNDVAGASGGGVSHLVTKPVYQSAPGVPADGFRDEPDISLLASPSTAGYVIVVGGTTSIIGGTSAAAPSWAGIVALLNQAAGSDGFGALNYGLYALGQAQYAEGGPVVFHDVTSGNNSFNRVTGFTAGPGYDLATGLGTPDVNLLANALPTALAPPTSTSTPTATETSTQTPTSTATSTQTITPSRTPSADRPTLMPSPTPTSKPCIGDCGNSGQVIVDDLLIMVNVALGNAAASTCTAGDANGDGRVTIDEILAAVNRALGGCP